MGPLGSSLVTSSPPDAHAADQQDGQPGRVMPRCNGFLALMCSPQSRQEGSSQVSGQGQAHAQDHQGDASGPAERVEFAKKQGQHERALERANAATGFVYPYLAARQLDHVAVLNCRDSDPRKDLHGEGRVPPRECRNGRLGQGIGPRYGHQDKCDGEQELPPCHTVCVRVLKAFSHMRRTGKKPDGGCHHGQRQPPMRQRPPGVGLLQQSGSCIRHGQKKGHAGCPAVGPWTGAGEGPGRLALRGGRCALVQVRERPLLFGLLGLVPSQPSQIDTQRRHSPAIGVLGVERPNQSQAFHQPPP